MTRPRTLALVLAGGAGGRLELLTQERAKPAVPFAGTHKLIDFPLSNCVASGISDVWVSQQVNPVSLNDHLSGGRPWDLDRTRGGLLVLQPRLGRAGRDRSSDHGGFRHGTADTIWRDARLMREFGPDVLVVLSADAVYRMDYGALVDEHMASGRAVTMVTTRVDPEDAGRYGVVEVDDAGAVTAYAHKPDEPPSDLVSNEVFVVDPEALLGVLDDLAEEAGEDGLSDLGEAAWPRLVAEGEVREHRLEGYWRDVGTIPAYHAAHMDLLAGEPPLDLDDPAWPVLTREAARRAPARVLAGGRVDGSALAPASRVAGHVEGSVVGRGAVVEEGAVVRGSVLLPGAVVRSGATVVRSVVDDGVEVGRGARVGADDGDLALLGLRARVPDGAELPAGARFPQV